MLSELFLRSVRLSAPIEKDSYLNSVLAVQHLMQNEIIFSKNVTFLSEKTEAENQHLLKLLLLLTDSIPRVEVKIFAFLQMILTLNYVRILHFQKDLREHGTVFFCVLKAFTTLQAILMKLTDYLLLTLRLLKAMEEFHFISNLTARVF